MYAPALDLKQGLVPYKDTLIAYGYLTNWIQSISLTLLGESLKSIGIATGAFYSLSLFLSYRIFLIFLSKPLSLFSVLLIFLIHPYIVHPWPNYFSYTLELLALLLFLNRGSAAVNRFGAGICLGLACLFRYSSAVAVIPPFFIYLCYEVFLSKDDRKLSIQRTSLFSLGLFIPFLWFFAFLISKNTLYDFYIQNRVIAEAWSRGVTVWNILPSLFKYIIFADTWPQRDSRSICFSIIFFFALIVVCHVGTKIFSYKKDLSRTDSAILIVSLAALCGYLNSAHLYQIFRLINGASIGIGVVIYSVDNLSRHFHRIRPALAVGAVVLCSIWTRTLLFTETSSVYLPWDRHSFTEKAVTPTDLKIFQGKRISEEYYNFYKEVSGTLAQFDHTYYIVNYTWDPLFTVLSNLKKPQLVPFYLGPPYYLPFAEYGYRDEPARIEQIITSKKAIILTSEERKIAGYKLVFAKPWSKDTPWFAREEGMKLYISVPEGP